MFKPAEKRLNDYVESFGCKNIDDVIIDAKFVNDPNPIPKGKSRVVAFTPFCGLFRQEKYSPIRYAPIQIELEVVGNATDAVVGNIVIGDPDTNTNKSENFLIEDVQLKCDLVELDNTLDNEYTAYLLEGKALPIHYTALTHASRVISSINTTANVTRGLTRLKAVLFLYSMMQY